MNSLRTHLLTKQTLEYVSRKCVASETRDVTAATLIKDTSFNSPQSALTQVRHLISIVLTHAILTGPNVSSRTLGFLRIDAQLH